MKRGHGKNRAGVTLVEVMLAGAMTALAVLATLEGFIVAAKIAHENAEALRADGDAFDVVWGRFNMQFGELNSNTTTNDFGSSTNSEYFIDIKYTYQLHGQEHSLWVRRSNVPDKRTFGIEEN
jgi:hypothetical protein